jgi:hypothetical protein
MGQTLEPLEDFQGWINELEAQLPATLPYARLGVCWQTADAWREEAGVDALSGAVFAIQEELYQPSVKHRMAIRCELGGLGKAFIGGRLRARRGQAMLRIVRGTAWSLLGGKSGRDDWSLGWMPRDQWAFPCFVRTGLWVFETEPFVSLIADAIGERILHEEGEWSLPEPEPLEDL